MGNRMGYVLIGIAALLAIAIASAAPVGPDTLQVTSSSRGTERTSSGIGALAGNVSELNISGTSVTQFWQGYYGNITGRIVLSDANNKSLYQWNLVSPTGEIYASRSATLNWSNVACADGQQILQEDTYLGANSGVDPDSMNLTFSGYTYNSFYTGFLNFTSGSCRAAGINGSTGGAFYEVLQVDGNNETNKTIYTSLISQNTVGYDSQLHDFQMIVGEPGSGAELYPNGAATTYYFWVELQ